MTRDPEVFLPYLIVDGWPRTNPSARNLPPCSASEARRGRCPSPPRDEGRRTMSPDEDMGRKRYERETQPMTPASAPTPPTCPDEALVNAAAYHTSDPPCGCTPCRHAREGARKALTAALAAASRPAPGAVEIPEPSEAEIAHILYADGPGMVMQESFTWCRRNARVAPSAERDAVVEAAQRWKIARLAYQISQSASATEILRREEAFLFDAIAALDRAGQGRGT